MRDVHLRQVDLNLLSTLYALLEERHVTRAAKRCFLSQPAMSRSLERIRDTFGDELLIRTGRIYERTVRGEWLLRELENLLPRLEALVRGEPFDPAQSRERLRVAVTDNGSIVLLPALTQRIRTAAADITLEIVAWHDRSFEDVEAGKIDLALSPFDCTVAAGNGEALQGGLRLPAGSRSSASLSPFHAEAISRAFSCRGDRAGQPTNIG